jgi:hypothetical protein
MDREDNLQPSQEECSYKTCQYQLGKIRYLILIFVAMSVSCIDRNPIPVDSLASCNDCFNTDYCVPVEFGDATPLEFDLTELNDVNLVGNGTFASSAGWTLGAYWTITGGELVLAGLGNPANSAYTDLDAEVVAGYYKITFDMTAGDLVSASDLQVTLGGENASQFTITSLFPGTYAITILAYIAAPSDNRITFTASTGDLAFDNLEVYRMSEVGFEIKDCDTEVVYYSEFDSSTVEYVENPAITMTGTTNSTDELYPAAVLTLDWDTYSLSRGCYCVCIKDAADVTFNYVANGVFDDDDFWTFTNVGASGWSVSANKLNKAKDATVGTDKAESELVTGLDILSCYTLQFDTTSDNGSEVEVRYSDGTDTDALLATVNVPIGSNSVSIDITGKDIVKIGFWAASTDEAFDIDNVVLSKTTDCTDCICTTVCVSLTTDHDTTMGRGCNFLLKATNDNNAFGFNFEDVTFEPQVRVFGKLRNLTFETDAEYYTKSTGEKILVYAEVEEKVELQIYEVPEYMHSVINMMMNMDSFMIDGVEYVRVGEYAPNWRKSSAKAPVIVQVAKKTQNRYNTYS